MASNLPKERLHPDIIKLGIVSFLTDLSSEMIFSVFAIFFTTVAGASASLLGLIEGLADFSASSLNYLAGWLSDRGGALDHDLKRFRFVSSRGHGSGRRQSSNRAIGSNLLDRRGNSERRRHRTGR